MKQLIIQLEKEISKNLPLTGLKLENSNQDIETIFGEKINDVKFVKPTFNMKK